MPSRGRVVGVKEALPLFDVILFKLSDGLDMFRQMPRDYWNDGSEIAQQRCYAYLATQTVSPMSMDDVTLPTDGLE